MPRTKKAAPETTKKTAAKTTQGRKPKQKLDLKRFYKSIGANFQANRQKYSRYLIVAGVIVLIAVFAFLKKDWFVVAVINREPVTSIELYQNLKAKYGEEVLAQIIRDKLIAQEANRLNISANQEEVDKKIKEVEDQLGGKEQLQQALAQSSITENDFRNQIKTQLLVEKILANKIGVDDKEIDDFISQNPTDPLVLGSDDNKGPNREEIRKQLRSNKLNQEFQTWYDELEKKSSILRF
jgi:parvulin-like peptidyl-prolyl isomerase